MMNIDKSINQFLEGNGKNKGRKPDERYASFDYCYNYFYSFQKNKKIKEMANDENIQMSCLQLGFYLASWGMLRGSSFLLEKSVRNFRNLIISISKMDSNLWEIDVDKYTDKNIDSLLRCREEIKEVLNQGDVSDTLVTKIMLGVFANVPAYDQYFRKSLGVHSMTKESLFKIKEFYEKNRDSIDSFKIRTFNFLSSKESDVFYSKAKIIDMYGFIKGLN